MWNELYNNTTINYNPPPSRFNVDIWFNELKDHPNHDYTAFILDGITNGFGIGHNGTIPTGKARNLPINNFEKIKITKWLFKRIKAGYILSPFSEKNNPFPDLVVSLVGAVPKDKTDVRPIHHLSAPRNNSGIAVNETIKERCAVEKSVSSSNNLMNNCFAVS